MAQLTADQVRSLDQIRTRLLTLRSSLAKLQENIAVSQPLPSISTLQTSANVVSNSLQAIAEQLAEHQQLLASTLVFPLPQYPGRHQAHILTDTLLRTKLEPAVEEWVQQGQDLAREQSGANGLSELERSKLWTWAPEAANREARKQKWGADYTLAEVKEGIANVVTGLQRELIEPEDGDDDDDNDGENDEYEDDGVVEEPTDDEGDQNDKMDIEQTASKPVSLNAAANGGGAQPTIAGRPAYLETLQEFITTGRIQRYEPLLVEQRREAERKTQSTQVV